MTAPATLASDIMVGAAGIARFLFDSDEFRYQRRVYYLRGRSKRQLPHFRLGNQIAARRSTLPPGLMRRMAFTMADSRISVNRSRLNELAAMMGLRAPHLTPPEQRTAWIRPIQESKVNLPLIACAIKATRQ